MRRPLTLLFVVTAALMSFLGTATAATPRPVVPASDVSPLVLSCPGGSLCVWPVADGSSSRCSWNNADNDWRNAPVVCSWSSSSTVKAVYNNGTSPNYAGVCLYRGANHTSYETFVAQGGTKTFAISPLLRSHKWVRSSELC
jgi:Peptidase inhibitor family I36